MPPQAPWHRIPWREYRHVLALAAPVILANISNNLLALADTLMVGSLGTTELAAVGYGLLLVFLIYGFPIGLISIGNAFAAQFFGAGRGADCRRLVRLALWLGLVAGLGVAALSWASDGLMALLGIEPEIRRQAFLYVSRRALGAPFLFVVVGWANVLNGLGHVRTPMTLSVLANAMNIGLNYLLIFGHGGFPAMGIEGAALATAASNLVSFLVFAAILKWRPPAVLRPPDGAGERPDRAFAREFFRVGLPNGVYVLLDIGGLFAFSTIVEWIGVTALAINQVPVRVMALSYMFNLGLSIAATTLVGQAAGAGRPAAVSRSARLALQLSAGVLVALSLAYLLAREPIVRAFSLEAALVAPAAAMVSLMVVFHFFDGLTIVLYGCLKGLGDTRFPTLVYMVGQWLLALPLAWALAIPAGLGLPGAWAALILEMAATGLVFWLRFRHLERRPGRWPLSAGAVR